MSQTLYLSPGGFSVFCSFVWWRLISFRKCAKCKPPCVWAGWIDLHTYFIFFFSFSEVGLSFLSLAFWIHWSSNVLKFWQAHFNSSPWMVHTVAFSDGFSRFCFRLPFSFHRWRATRSRTIVDSTICLHSLREHLYWVRVFMWKLWCRSLFRWSRFVPPSMWTE